MRPIRSEYAANIALARHDADAVSPTLRERNREAVCVAWAAKRQREARAERVSRALFCIIVAALPAVIFLAATSGA